jgi:purine-binding chemotaxis protein CheW
MTAPDDREKHGGKAMANESFLVFGLQGQLLALETMAVREIISLGEVTPLDETPPYITGIINLRGQVIPVMDLNRRFGRTPQRYRLTDSIIVMAAAGLQVGLIAQEVHEEINLAPENITPAPAVGLNGGMPPRFATRVAKGRGNLIILLNHLNLLQDEALPEEAVLEEAPEPQPAGTYFCPEASPEERAVFRERALSLAQAQVDEGAAGLIPIAVVGLNGEYFGVDLELVREFTGIRHLTPIPCCPGHIVGNMNLRGNILTLVDLRGLLGLPEGLLKEDDQVIVASLGDLTAGVVVDQVYDIVYLNPLNLGPVPTAVHKTWDKYLDGTAPYGGRMMTILNLGHLLSAESLVVDEEP